MRGIDCSGRNIVGAARIVLAGIDIKNIQCS